MESVSNHIESLFAKAGDYAETRAKLLKLKVADKASDTVSDAASMLVVWIFAIFFLLIFSVGLALLVGELLGKNYYGFFIVAGIYGIAGIIFRVNKIRFIKTPVSNFIISKILKSAS